MGWVARVELERTEEGALYCGIIRFNLKSVFYNLLTPKKQARKAWRCDSYIIIQYETINDPLTHSLTGVTTKRCYRI